MGCNCSCGNNAARVKPDIEGIIDLAVKIEQAGQKFYSALAIVEYNDKIKDLLVFLAEEEAKHVKAFENLKNSLEEDVLSEKLSEDYVNYLKCLAQTHMFYNIDFEDADYKVDTARATLELALKFERDSIAVFQEMKEIVGNNGKVALDKLLAQERGHIMTLAHHFDKV